MKIHAVVHGRNFLCHGRKKERKEDNNGRKEKIKSRKINRVNHNKVFPKKSFDTIT